MAVGNNVKKTVDGNVISVDKGASLTQTFDFTYVRMFSKTINLMVGVSYATPSDEFNQLKNISNPGTNYFIYTMLTVKPKLFSSEK